MARQPERDIAMDRSVFAFSHRTNNFATHQPVLCTAVELSDGPVAEFGCGYGSTPLLHKFCAEQGRPVVTFESNTEWIDKIRTEFESDTHWFIEVKDWKTIVEHPVVQQTDWGLLFVDQAPFEARLWTVNALGDLPAYFVLHDCDYFPEPFFFLQEYRPCRNRYTTSILCVEIERSPSPRPLPRATQILVFWARILDPTGRPKSCFRCHPFRS